MSLTQKNHKGKTLNKKRLPESVAVTKSRVSYNAYLLPEKFKEMDEMLKKTTFLP